jgi:hypothetical protein
LFSGGAVEQQPNSSWIFQWRFEKDNPASLGIMFYLYAPQINKYQKGSAADSGVSILGGSMVNLLEPEWYV